MTAGTDGEGDEGQPRARDIVRDAENKAHPMVHVPDATDLIPADDGAGGSTRMLSSLMSRAPFHDLFCKVAERTYVGKVTESKVKKMHDEHRGYFRACIIADFIVRAVVTVMFVAIVGLIAYKTLWPLPRPFG